jgi:hypothetical protein
MKGITNLILDLAHQTFQCDMNLGTSLYLLAVGIWASLRDFQEMKQ